MNGRSTWRAALFGVSLFCAAQSSVEAGQAFVQMQPSTFIGRCIDHGRIRGGGDSYTCDGFQTADVAKVSCVFGVEGTLCIWSDGSEALAGKLIGGAITNRGLPVEAGSHTSFDAEPAPRALLPSFGGRKAGTP